MLVFLVFQLFTTGVELGTIPPIPPGSSIADVLGIPLIQSVIDELLPLISGGGGAPDISSILQPLIIWFLTPLIVVIVTGIIGAIVRPKE